MSIIPSSSGNSSNPLSVIWDQFNDFAEFSRENSSFVNTQIDWDETPDAHMLKAEIPGLQNGEVRVEVEDERVLLISGMRDLVIEDKNDNHVERCSGKFMRRFTLPEDAKTNQIIACMENGVLTITVPKAKTKKPQYITMQIHQGHQSN
ncbi:hypothetical protein L6164_032883 [Bauhinia variegata]|uniref:Uncharacterized protein n=1 Tax=Bauhinia variegata TaxID=167791 RepID=A0ACB9KQ68_BAUVA|nr:hypothetical protein L6164_032883 [Bauhinia variegata]